MSAEIIDNVRFSEEADLPEDAILRESMGKLKTCVVVGFDHQGDEYAVSSIAGGPEALWVLQFAINKLMAGALKRHGGEE
jgi:hypothetical protein